MNELRDIVKLQFYLFIYIFSILSLKTQAIIDKIQIYPTALILKVIDDVAEHMESCYVTVILIPLYTQLLSLSKNT